jgi:SAM-dependent methyltransferase
MFTIALRHILTLPANERIWIDIGAGHSSTIANLVHPQHYYYTYIATDISYAGLDRGRRIAASVPVQHAASAVPFAPASAAVVSGLGVLHHFPDPAQTLRDMIALLAPGGILVLHEVRNKPRIGLGRTRSLTAAKDSPHEGHIDEEEVRAIIDASCDTVYHARSMTPGLVALSMAFKLDRFCARSHRLTKLAAAVDDAFAMTVSRLHPALQPWEMFLVAKCRGCP